MRFGYPDRFAIDAIVEPQLKPPSRMWGRMCLWVQGTSLGDSSREHCDLAVPRDSLLALIRQLPELWSEELNNLSDPALWRLLNDSLYGDGLKPEFEHVQGEAASYAKFDFLTNWSESFDGFKSFVFCPDGRTVRVLNRSRNDMLLALETTVVDVREAIREYLSWYEAKEALLMASQP